MHRFMKSQAMVVAYTHLKSKTLYQEEGCKKVIKIYSYSVWEETGQVGLKAPSFG